VDISGRTALVTGGQRGLGRALAAALLEQGAATVYVTARRPVPTGDPRLVPVELEVTDAAQVAALAQRLGDVSIVVNNAGVDRSTDLLTGDFAGVRDEFEVNVLGLLAVSRAFAPVLAAKGGGALLNVHSALSWANLGNGYSASKAAAWSVTNGLRAALEPAGTLVTGLHLGYADTDMTAHVDAPKSDPRDIAREAVLGLLAGRNEVLADDTSRSVKAALAGDPVHLGLARAAA